MRRASSSLSNPFDGLAEDAALGLFLKKLNKLRDADVFKVPVDWKVSR